MFNFSIYSDEIKKICEKYNVLRLSVFGSAVTEKFNDASDIDLLLELDNEISSNIIIYMKLKNELEDLFGHQIDLVMPKAITNSRLKKEIFSYCRDIYAA